MRFDENKIIIYIDETICKTCKIPIDRNTSRPDEENFRKYIPYFVQDVPDEVCAKAGRASYFDVS